MFLLAWACMNPCSWARSPCSFYKITILFQKITILFHNRGKSWKKISKASISRSQQQQNNNIPFPSISSLSVLFCVEAWRRNHHQSHHLDLTHLFDITLGTALGVLLGTELANYEGTTNGNNDGICKEHSILKWIKDKFVCTKSKFTMVTGLFVKCTGDPFLKLTIYPFVPKKGIAMLD
jgi:hypothetical protein